MFQRQRILLTYVASRGADLTPFSWNGPDHDWLSDRSKWPENLVTSPSITFEAEAQVVREVAVVTLSPNQLETVLEK